MRTELPASLTQTADGQIIEGVLRSCVHCGMCNATCPTYQLTGDELDGPRGRIYLLKGALESGVMGPIAQRHLDRCLGCRACETTCPSGVQYHRLFDLGREVLPPAEPRRFKQRMMRILLAIFVPNPAWLRPAVKFGRWLSPLLSQRLRVPGRVRVAAAKPEALTRRMLLLTGCAQSVLAEHFNEVTRRVYARLGIELIEVKDAVCCGALSFHLEWRAAGRARARQNIDAWWPYLEQGAEAIVVNASGCALFVKEYAELLQHDAQYAEKARRIAALVCDPIETLSRECPAAVRAPAQPRIAVHDPCTLQHGLKLRGRVADLLRQLGFDPQPVVDAHLCCGSAGSYSILQPELANALREAKLTALNSGRPAAIYTANIGCWQHLGREATIPVRHWIEAVDEVTAEGTL